MRSRPQDGFSLIELLIVIVILGIIASIGIPTFNKAKLTAENKAAMQTTRVMTQAQVHFFSENSRFASLSELNTENDNKFGTTSADTILRGGFTYTMSPDFQTVEELKQNYEFVVSRTTSAAELPYVVKVDSTGEIVQITP